MLETHDLQQFQQLLGSNNDIEMIKNGWLMSKDSLNGMAQPYSLKPL